MVVTGAVAGLVALELRAKFRRAVEEAVSRERVTNLFGQHVSPSSLTACWIVRRSSRATSARSA